MSCDTWTTSTRKHEVVTSITLMALCPDMLGIHIGCKYDIHIMCCSPSAGRANSFYTASRVVVVLTSQAHECLARLIAAVALES